MSNFYETPPPKVISIKKVEVSKQENESTNEISLEDKKTALEIEVKDLEQQIRSLKEKSDQMLIELREQMNEEKEAWQLEKENERKAAQQKGYEEGYKQGQQAALQQYEKLLQDANEIVEKATEDYHRTIQKHEQAIIVLAIKTAEKILTKEIQEDKSYVTSMIRKAMEELKDHSNIAIYVSPNDYELVMNQKQELEQSVKDGELLSVYIDATLDEGDCVISHPFGQIDISLDVQLQQIKHALEEKIAENE